MAQRKDTRLTGINVLSYLGVNPLSPSNSAAYQRAPTQNDRMNFNIGDVWIDQSTVPPDVWMLVGILGNVATWIKLAEGSAVGEEFVTDAGTAIPSSGVLNIIGDPAGPLQTSALSNTVTVSSDGTIASIYQTDTLFCSPSGGTLIVTGGPSVTTVGSGNTLTINVDGDVATTYTADAGSATPAANTIKIAGGANVTTSGSGAIITITSSGGGGGAANASFLAHQAADGGSPAAAGVYLGAAVAMTAVYDVGANFTVGDGAGTSAAFTSPQDGKYFLQMQIRFQRIGGIAVSAIDNYGEIQTSNRTYRNSLEITYTGATTSHERAVILNVMADMDLGDTAEFFGLVNDVGGTFDIKGDVGGTGEYETFVSGTLADVDSTSFTQHAVLVGNATGDIGELALASDGEVLIGATGAASAWSTITAGTNITVTGGANTIEIASTGGGIGSSIASFFAYQATDPLVLNSSSFYTVFFGADVALTELFDTGSNFDPGDGAGTPAQFVAPQAGVYQFSIQSVMIAQNTLTTLTGRIISDLYLEDPSGAISKYNTSWYYQVKRDPEYIAQTLNVITEMDMGDIVKARVEWRKSPVVVGDESGLSMGISGAGAQTFFSGTLV